MDDSDAYARITLRIPRDLHARLTTAAAAESHSMNAEIVRRLAQSFEDHWGIFASDKMTDEKEVLAAKQREINSIKALISVAEQELSIWDSKLDEGPDQETGRFIVLSSRVTEERIRFLRAVVRQLERGPRKNLATVQKYTDPMQADAYIASQPRKKTDKNG